MEDAKAYKQALDVRKRAIAGEDFGKLAVEFSQDPSAKENKGDLGYFTAFRMVYAFETGAYKTPKGSVSNPIRTRFGYHLIFFSLSFFFFFQLFQLFLHLL